MPVIVHESRIALPAGFRAADVFAFHGRDAEGVAEQVAPPVLRKGVLLGGAPVLLELRCEPGQALCAAHIDLAAGAAATAQTLRALDDAWLNILGLRIDPAAFFAFAANDAQLGPLARRHAGLRVVQSATVFEALTWAIIGQQINLNFAIALRRTFILQAGRQHSGGMWCYPDASAVARLELEALTSRKFSRAKAETLLRLARAVDAGELDLERDADIDVVTAALLAIKGIGPWTVNYALLRGYGYADCSLHGDVAIRAALQKLLGEDAKPDMARTQRWLAHYAPHRTMTAAHLWASLAPDTGNQESQA
ncbi:MAG: DNA-3-methyladenine glycosylase 2 [Pseudomonadota bacterium]